MLAKIGEYFFCRPPERVKYSGDGRARQTAQAAVPGANPASFTVKKNPEDKTVKCHFISNLHRLNVAYLIWGSCIWTNLLP